MPLAPSEAHLKRTWKEPSNDTELELNVDWQSNTVLTEMGKDIPWIARPMFHSLKIDGKKRRGEKKNKKN